MSTPGLREFDNTPGPVTHDPHSSAAYHTFTHRLISVLLFFSSSTDGSQSCSTRRMAYWTQKMFSHSPRMLWAHTPLPRTETSRWPSCPGTLKTTTSPSPSGGLSATLTTSSLHPTRTKCAVSVCLLWWWCARGGAGLDGNQALGRIGGNWDLFKFLTNPNQWLGPYQLALFSCTLPYPRRQLQHFALLEVIKKTQ